MNVICDSSVLITLSLLNQFHLLRDMFGRILVPPGVYNEVVRIGVGRVGADNVRNTDFIDVVALNEPDKVNNYIDPLSRTDAELIVLAKEQPADLMLTNDRDLRKQARREDIPFTSLFDLLVLAKESRLLQSVKPLIDELRNQEVLNSRRGLSRDLAASQ